MRNAEIEKAAQLAQDKGFQNEGRVNTYRCIGKSKFSPKGATAGCGHLMVTVDREEGVTPFLTKCPQCDGDAQSAMYRVPPGLQPTHEWLRPDNFDGLNLSTIEHIKMGGLILRKIVQPAAALETSKAHRQPEWQRFVGDISMVAMTVGNVPTVGIGSDICDECDTRRVLIACISEAGNECNVGVAPEEALKIADAIRRAALKVIAAKGHS